MYIYMIYEANIQNILHKLKHITYYLINNTTFMDIHEKIKAIIDALNLNNNSFSKEIGVTSSTIDSITNGRSQPDGSKKRTKPGYDLLNSIIKNCDVNPDYLFGSSDVMFQSEEKQIQEPLNRFTNTLRMPKVITVKEDGEENISFVGVKARAGYLNGYGDLDYIENLPSFSMPMLNNGTYRCFEVQGNSMVTTLYDGDVIFGKYVDDLRNIIDGRIYIIVSKNDGVVVKRVINRIQESGKLILKSDNTNGNYPTYTVPVEDVVEVWYASMYASRQMPDPVDIFERMHALEGKLIEVEELLKSSKK